MRTARLFVVAAAIGATASAAVVFSLMDRPAAEASVAARTLVQPVEPAVPARSAPLVAQVQTPSEPPSFSQTQRADTSSAMRPQGATVAVHARARHLPLPTSPARRRRRSSGQPSLPPWPKLRNPHLHQHQHRGW